MKRYTQKTRKFWIRIQKKVQNIPKIGINNYYRSFFICQSLEIQNTFSAEERNSLLQSSCYTWKNGKENELSELFKILSAVSRVLSTYFEMTAYANAIHWNMTTSIQFGSFVEKYFASLLVNDFLMVLI